MTHGLRLLLACDVALLIIGTALTGDVGHRFA
jgi:hypothetical protein